MRNLPKHQSGVSMMEALVTIVIVSSSVLALAFLQGAGLHFNHDSYSRSQATILAYNIIDRIRGNGITATSAEAAEYTATPSQSEILSCNATAASRANDRNCWYQALSNLLAKGNGNISVTGSDFVVQVAWLDRFAGGNTHTDTQAECEAENRVWSTSLTWGSSNPAPNPPSCLQTQRWVARL